MQHGLWAGMLSHIRAAVCEIRPLKIKQLFEKKNTEMGLMQRLPGGCRAIRGNPMISHIKVSFFLRVVSKALKEVVGPGRKKKEKFCFRQKLCEI